MAAKKLKQVKKNCVLDLKFCASDIIFTSLKNSTMTHRRRMHCKNKYTHKVLQDTVLYFAEVSKNL